MFSVPCIAHVDKLAIKPMLRDTKREKETCKRGYPHSVYTKSYIKLSGIEFNNRGGRERAGVNPCRVAHKYCPRGEQLNT